MFKFDNDIYQIFHFLNFFYLKVRMIKEQKRDTYYVFLQIEFKHSLFLGYNAWLYNTGFLQWVGKTLYLGTCYDTHTILLHFYFFSFGHFKILSFIEKLLHMMSFHGDKILVDFHGCALRKIKGSPVLKAQWETKGAQHMLYMYMGKERKIP